jgi:hypothetical protein
MRMLVVLSLVIMGLVVSGGSAKAAQSACNSCKSQAYDRCRADKAQNSWSEAQFKDCLRLGRKNCAPQYLILTKPGN